MITPDLSWKWDIRAVRLWGYEFVGFPDAADIIPFWDEESSIIGMISSAKGITATSGQPESISRHEGPRRWSLTFNTGISYPMTHSLLHQENRAASQGVILMCGGLVTVERQKTFHLFLGFLCHNRNHNPLGLKPLVKDLLKAIGALMLQNFSY